jgi:hypothetical protein
MYNPAGRVITGEADVGKHEDNYMYNPAGRVITGEADVGKHEDKLSLIVKCTKVRGSKSFNGR